jgi:hypothetical protein
VAAISARTVAPLVALGATWAVRKVMTTAYTSRTGHEPPQSDDPEVPLVKILMWAVSTSVVSAAVEVIIIRVVASLDDDSTDYAITSGTSRD